ncbi:hypothetical protein N9B40_00920 [Akkermansiaceae bacterium]|nr:hypothetical protein [Akkermansiaceae bacterium]
MKTLFFLSLLASPFLQAGQFDHTRVPGNAEWYLHLDLEQLRETKFGEVVIREISKDHDDKIAHIEGSLNSIHSKTSTTSPFSAMEKKITLPSSSRAEWIVNISKKQSPKPTTAA